DTISLNHTRQVTFGLVGTNTYNIGALQGPDNLEIGGNTLSVGAKNLDTEYSGVISGTGGGLTKVGTGTLTLAITAKTYTGNTTVSEGTLKLNNPNFNNESSTVTLAASGATLELNFDETGGPVTDTVDKLFIGAVQQNAGVYKATDNVTDTGTPIAQITGPGTLTVTTGPAGGFSSWQTANGGAGLTGGISADHDNDGVPNGVEYFLGGTTLPEANTTGFTALPGITPGSPLTVTWTMADSYSGTYGTANDFWVETSETLTGAWTPIDEGVGADKVQISGNNVTYTFPAGPAKKFARLVVTGP
ncbi:MAG: autotransporter-associated beta strand repeat-containing protein, partial [Akkermansiaceae bacterium]|nr:autotransporter-associated beta strand repeat-containing protein [Akkermansiaceae bacterium]